MDNDVSFFGRAVRSIGRALVNFIRPWPLQPYIVLALIPFYLSWSAAAVVIAGATGAPPPSAPEIAVSILAPVGLLAAVFYVAERIYGPRVAPPWPVYYGVVILASLVSYFSRVASLRFFDSPISEAQLWNLYDVATPVVAIGRSVITLMLLLSIFGVYAQRLGGEVRRAEDALALAKLQQQRLVRADEATRRQVGSVLHDEIQSSILTIGMQVEQIAREVPAETGDRLRSIADELEYVRGERIHAVIAELAPEFTLVGLPQALGSLARRYRKTMTVKLDLDADAVQMAYGDPEISEACYRIVEQALLNSGVHGRATEVTIRLLRDEDAVDLDVDDNGVGLGSVSTPGLGTGVTEAWVSQLGGSWSRIAAESGGVRLTASLPLRSR